MAVAKEADQLSTLEQYAFRSFSVALEAVPLALAENSGLSPIETLSELKSHQLKESTALYGVDCMLTGNSNMKDHNVVESLHSKKQQIILATQLVKMILKIDDVRSPMDDAPHY